MKSNNFQIIIVLIFCALILTAKSFGQHPSENKTYTNPISQDIYLGDPFILHHNGFYYLYGTTSTHEGFKCWKSSNMFDWKYEGFAYKKNKDSWGKGSYWAPEVSYFNGEFYLAYSAKGTQNGEDKMLLCLAKSESPTGPFKDIYAPWFDLGFSCIDAHLFYDDDQHNYLFFDKVGYEGKWPDGYMYGLIYCLNIDENFKPIGDTVFCSKAEQEWENPLSMHSRCNEGSFVFKHAGKYYMTYSANHYEDPFYGIGYSIADSPLGPWMKSPDNPLIYKNEEKGILGPGHNCFVTSPDESELFIVYHTHVSETDKRRQVNIDRAVFNENGKLIIKGPTRTPQKLPSGED